VQRRDAGEGQEYKIVSADCGRAGCTLVLGVLGLPSTRFPFPCISMLVGPDSLLSFLLKDNFLRGLPSLPLFHILVRLLIGHSGGC
jgi:hypothetical protein